MSKRLARLAVLVAALAGFVVLSRGWPKDRAMHFVLGDAAPRVEALTVGYSEGGDEFTRGASFHFAHGAAPRIVTHEVRLAEGDYTIEIEVASRSEIGASEQRSTLRRHVRVDESSASIDVSKAVPK